MADSDFVAAVKRARQGDKPTLDGFGLERVALAGDLWRESFTVDGAGRGSVTSLRAIDARAVGEFAGKLDASDVQRLLEVVERTSFAALKPGHTEPYAMRVELSIVVGGRDYGWQMPAAPEAHEPLTELLVEIDRLSGAVVRTPIAALDAKLALDPVQAGAADCGVTVELHNQGSEGTWVVNPATFGPSDDQPNDSLVIRYGRQVPVDPGANPPPIIFSNEDVTLQDASPARLLWIPAGGTLVLRGRASLALGTGRYRLHAVYSSYTSPAHVAGRRLFRGRVVSPDAVIEVA
jgi:hypothetical protein